MPTWGWIIIVFVAYWAGFWTCALFANRRIMEARWKVGHLRDIIDDMRTACKGGAA